MPAKLTQEEFIKRSNQIHKNIYNYDLVNYVNGSVSVKIKCDKHGVFEQNPRSHLNGFGCSKCGLGTLTTEEFVKKSILVHGEKYDYSKVNYINTTEKVEICCIKHGSFKQNPRSHLRGEGCSKCVKRHPYTTEEFISKAKDIHKNTYEYSKTIYKNGKTKVIISCKNHGDFLQMPYNHLSGNGCPICFGNFTSNTECFINKAKLIHGDKFDYSKVNYVNNRIKVILICKRHGEFLQAPNKHLSGKGCLACSGKIKLTNEEFIKRAIAIHNKRYDYSLIEYKNFSENIEILCKDHGSFWQSPRNHLAGKGCYSCNKSKGEVFIENYLINNKINFVSPKRFEKCRHKKELPFDFYLDQYNLCIEFDGEQHFKTNVFLGGDKDLKERQMRDEIKTKFCKDNDIKLLRIRYDEDIKEKLDNFFKENFTTT